MKGKVLSVEFSVFECKKDVKDEWATFSGDLRKQFEKRMRPGQFLPTKSALSEFCLRRNGGNPFPLHGKLGCFRVLPVDLWESREDSGGPLRGLAALDTLGWGETWTGESEPREGNVPLGWEPPFHLSDPNLIGL